MAGPRARHRAFYTNFSYQGFASATVRIGDGDGTDATEPADASEH